MKKDNLNQRWRENTLEFPPSSLISHLFISNLFSLSYLLLCAATNLPTWQWGQSKSGTKFKAWCSDLWARYGFEKKHHSTAIARATERSTEPWQYVKTNWPAGIKETKTTDKRCELWQRGVWQHRGTTTKQRQYQVGCWRGIRWSSWIYTKGNPKCQRRLRIKCFSQSPMDYQERDRRRYAGSIGRWWRGYLPWSWSATQQAKLADVLVASYEGSTLTSYSAIASHSQFASRHPTPQSVANQSSHTVRYI